MFELNTSAFGKYRRYALHHPEAGLGFSLVPEMGATVLELTFNGTNILDGYPTPEALEEGKWGKSALLFPFPNRLRDGKYHWEGQDYQFPLNNPATGNAIHGFARHSAFEVTRIELTTESAEISCQMEYQGQHEGYPFPLVLEVTYTMTVRPDFSVQFFVRNRHNKPIPVGFGWHPYFRLSERADDHLLQLPACKKVEIDARMIPTGARAPYEPFHSESRINSAEIDNCFAFADHHHLYHIGLRGGGHYITLAAASNLFPFFQVFTPPHRDSVALEPMTCNVDAFNNGEGLVSIPAGGDWLGAFRLEYHHP